MRRFSDALLALSGLMLIAACGESDLRQDPARVREYRIAAQFSLETIGTDARDVVGSESGGYWVLADHEPFLTEFDSSGVVIESFGRRGRGPTDLLAPWSLVLDRESRTVWVFDAGRHQLIEARSLRTVPRTIPLRTVSGPVRADFRQVSHGDIATVWKAGGRIVAARYPGEASVTRHLLQPTLVVYDTSGAPYDTLFDYRTGTDTSEIGGALDLVPIPLWIACWDDRIVTLDGLTGALTAHWVDGRPSQVLPISNLDLTPRPTSERAIEQYVRGQLLHEYRGSTLPQELPTMATQVVRANRSRFSPLLPAAARLRCGPDDGVLVEEFSLEDDLLGFGRRWHLIRSSDLQVEQLILPVGFEPRYATGNGLVGLLRDVDGRAHIAIAVDQSGSTDSPSTATRRSP